MSYAITSKENKLIKLIKSLHHKKYRQEEGKFFVEGIKIVGEALKERVMIENIVICPDIIEKVTGGKEFIETINRRNITVGYIDKNIFMDICDTQTPQGVLAVISQNKKIFDEMTIKENILYVVLEAVQDPGNLGTIIRTADAVGADGVILSAGCADPYSPKTLRSSMGSIFRVNVFEEPVIVNTIKNMKNNGIKVMVSSLGSDKYYFDLDFKGKVAIVIGSEAHGVSKEVLECADDVVKIPMNKGIESLNASVAAGVLMYEKYRANLMGSSSK